jgi:hypothetical protein
MRREAEERDECSVCGERVSVFENGLDLIVQIVRVQFSFGL